MRSDVKKHASALILCAAIFVIVLIAVLYDGILNAPPKPVEIAPVFTEDDPLIEVESNTVLININEANEEVLSLLPGIGPVTAEAICAYRSENGAFGDVSQLLNVSGIGEATLEKLLPHITCE